MRKEDNAVRLERKTERVPFSTCWYWVGAHTRGYGTFWDNTEQRTVRAHRYVYQTTYGEIPEGMYVCHACDEPSCINPSHLFLGSQAENMADMVKKGRKRKGEERPEAKLTENDVLEILATKGEVTNRACSEKYGVSLGVVAKIRTNRRWKHLQ